MVELSHEMQLLTFVRTAIDKVFGESSDVTKELVLEAFLSIQEVERFQKTNQVVKITQLLEELSLAVASIEEEN